MKKSDYLQVLAAIESALLFAIVAAAFTVDSSVVSSLYLYELMGSLAAALITTYGLYKMHDIT